MKDQRHWLILGATALGTASLLSGCSSFESKDSEQPLVAEHSTLVAKDQMAGIQAVDRNDGLEGELVVSTATVNAIDKKNRVVSMKSPEGKVSKIKCRPDFRNFTQFRVGDEVKTSWLKTIELFASGNDEPAAERVTEVGHAPLGSKPGFAAIDIAEMKATVVAIDYQTRKVTLKGPEGNVVNVTVGSEVKHLNEFNTGDSVVVRLTRAVSIEVSKPATN